MNAAAAEHSPTRKKWKSFGGVSSQIVAIDGLIEKTDLSHGTLHRIIDQELELSKVSARRAPLCI